MAALLSLSPGVLVHPIDRPDVVRTVQKFNESVEKIRLMAPIKIYYTVTEHEEGCTQVPIYTHEYKYFTREIDANANGNLESLTAVKDEFGDIYEVKCDDKTIELFKLTVMRHVEEQLRYQDGQRNKTFIENEMRKQNQIASLERELARLKTN